VISFFACAYPFFCTVCQDVVEKRDGAGCIDTREIPDKVLTSFTETQYLPPASAPDVENYRSYLSTVNPIAESETHFLDPTDDLVCLTPDRVSPTTLTPATTPQKEPPRKTATLGDNSPS
jgi:hypothetical protein